MISAGFLRSSNFPGAFRRSTRAHRRGRPGVASQAPPGRRRRPGSSRKRPESLQVSAHAGDDPLRAMIAPPAHHGWIDGNRKDWASTLAHGHGAIQARGLSDSACRRTVAFGCTAILAANYPPNSQIFPWILDAALWTLDAKTRVGRGFPVAFRCRTLIIKNLIFF